MMIQVLGNGKKEDHSLKLVGNTHRAGGQIHIALGGKTARGEKTGLSKRGRKAKRLLKGKTVTGARWKAVKSWLFWEKGGGGWSAPEKAIVECKGGTNPPKAGPCLTEGGA